MPAVTPSRLPRNQVLAWLIWSIAPVVVLGVGFVLSFTLPLQTLSTFVIWTVLLGALTLASLVGLFFWIREAQNQTISQKNNLRVLSLSSITSVLSWTLFALTVTGVLSLSGLPIGMGTLIQGALLLLGTEMVMVAGRALFKLPIFRWGVATALGGHSEGASLVPAAGLRAHSPGGLLSIAVASPPGASDGKTATLSPSPLSPSAHDALAHRATTPRAQRQQNPELNLALTSTDALPAPSRPIRPLVDLRNPGRPLTDREKIERTKLPMNDEEHEFFRLIRARKEQEAIKYFDEQWSKHKVRVNFRDEVGYTPLLLAEIYGLKKLRNVLRRFKARYINFEGYESSSGGWDCSELITFINNLIQRNDEGAFKALKFMLSEEGHFPWGAKYNGLNVRSYIASLGPKHLEMLKLFVETYEGSVDAGAKSRAVTPLIAAARAGHVEVVKYLLGKGANKAYTTSDGKDALTEAEENWHYEVVALLNVKEHQQGGTLTP